MSPVVMRRFLWLSLVFTVPFPYFMVDIGLMPTAWLAIVAIVVSASAILDGFAGTWRIALLFILQAASYGALLYVVARIGARSLHRRVPEQLRLPLVLGIALLLGAIACLPIYRNELVNTDPTMRIFDVY
jgi:hypothetical protein